MKREYVECDICRSSMRGWVDWEQKPFHFKLSLPRDGINGGEWSMDLCGPCRRELHDEINNAINRMRRAANAKAEGAE